MFPFAAKFFCEFICLFCFSSSEWGVWYKNDDLDAKNKQNKDQQHNRSRRRRIKRTTTKNEINFNNDDDVVCVGVYRTY